MKTSGLFTVHRYEIFSENKQKFYIIPFGDVHFGADLHYDEKFDEWCKKTAEFAKRNNVYFLGMGDYLDLASTSERAILDNKALHSTTRVTFDDMYRKYVRRFADKISFMKGKIIAMVNGNHFSNLTTGINTDQLLCEYLNCHYAGVSCFIRVFVKNKIKRGNHFDIWAHHGLGGGRTAGASIMKLEHMMRVATADVYLMGHDHTKKASMDSVLSLSDSRSGLTLRNRKIILARTGSFLRGYVHDKQSYIADAALPPTDLGTVLITCEPIRVSEKVRNKTIKDYTDIDLTVSF